VRWSPTLFAMLAISAIVLGAAGASATRTVEEATVQGRIEVGAGAEALGDRRSAFVSQGDQAPFGVFAAPDAADRAVAEVTVDPRTSADTTFRLMLCKADCVAEDPDVFASTSGGESLRVAAPVPEASLIGWRIETASGSSVSAEIDGTVRLVADGPTPGTAQDGVRSDRGPDIGGPGIPFVDAILPEGLLGLLTAVASRAIRARTGTGGSWPWGRALDDERDLLDNTVRREIYDLVNERPGVHLSELRRTVDVGQGALEHHVRRLEEAGLVRSERLGGYRCFFPPGDRDAAIEHATRAIRSRKARSILAAAIRAGDVRMTRLSKDLDLPTSTLHYHVEALADAGIVEKGNREGQVSISPTPLGQRLGRIYDLA